MTDGVLVHAGTVVSVLYGYKPELLVEAGNTLIPLMNVSNFHPGSLYNPPISNTPTIGTTDLAVALLNKGVLTESDLMSLGPV